MRRAITVSGYITVCVWTYDSIFKDKLKGPIWVWIQKSGCQWFLTIRCLSLFLKVHYILSHCTIRHIFIRFNLVISSNWTNHWALRDYRLILRQRWQAESYKILHFHWTTIPLNTLLLRTICQINQGPIICYLHCIRQVCFKTYHPVSSNSVEKLSDP